MGIILFSLSWLYQHRNLPSIWVKILLPIVWGIFLAWNSSHIVFSFIFGLVIGIITTPIMLAASLNANPHKNHLAKEKQESDDSV